MHTHKTWENGMETETREEISNKTLVQRVKIMFCGFSAQLRSLEKEIERVQNTKHNLQN